MTKQELNRDIKRLVNRYLEITNSKYYDVHMDEYYNLLDKEIKPELRRLIYADSDFSYLNINSLKALISLNGSLRVVPFHHFGIHIKLQDLYK